MRVAWAVVGCGVASALALLWACGVDTSGTCDQCGDAGGDGGGVEGSVEADVGTTEGGDGAGLDGSGCDTNADPAMEPGRG